MNTTKKDKAIKDINIQAMKANNRTVNIIVAIVFLTLGLVGGYFAAINVITDSQFKAMEVVRSVASQSK